MLSPLSARAGASVLGIALAFIGPHGPDRPFRIGAPAIDVGDAHAVPEAAVSNDNRVPAGSLIDGVLRISLEAREVIWFPEGEQRTGLTVYAFAESGKQAAVPGPMIRVTAGTEIQATVRNSLPKPMRFRGLQSRGSAAMDSTVLVPGATQTFRFRADTPGTYYYWGRTEPSPANAGPGLLRDGLLLGAFIVDSPGTASAPEERVFVISVWADTVAALGVKSERADRVLRREIVPRERWLVAALNGRSWPHTERLSHQVGDTVRWRIINGSRYPHPMHLHGFYFDVTARGDAQRDTVFDAAQTRMAVTEWLTPGTTISMRWGAERPGNWLWHCHIVTHISDATRLGASPIGVTSHHNHAETGMAGLIMGIQVGPGQPVTQAGDAQSRRRLRLFITERARVYGDYPGYSYVLQEGTPPSPDSIRPLSSTLTLRQHETTEIAIHNSTKDMATIHWHGLELESFYDGVGDWSGWGTRVAPPIAPGDSFVVRLTPPRAGTFIYHTHSDEGIRLASGLYGALLVLAEQAATDSSEQLFVMAMDGPHDDARHLINGLQTLPPIELRQGQSYRFRFINIAPLESRTVPLMSSGQLQPWRVLAKDGADLPPHRSIPQPGTIFLHPGETYDVEVMRQRSGPLTLRFIGAETAANRAAFVARAKPGDPIPRIVVDIPIIVR